MATRGKHRMANVKEDCCAVRRRMHRNLAPWVAEFTHHLLETGHTDLTARSYARLARHLAHWLALAKIAVVDIDEAVIGRFAQHRCRCFGKRRVARVSVRYVRRVRRVVAFLSEGRTARPKPTSVVPALVRRVAQFQD